MATATVMDLTTRAEAPQQTQNYAISMTTLQGFELAQRAAKALSQSTLVPKEYQGHLPNCIVALNMAQRLNADPLMVMQNLVIVHGRPTWSAQFMISTANACGRFSALRYEWRGDENKDDWGCRAWAIERDTQERLEGTWVSIGMAKKEGWYQKNGSKWQTMPQQMLMYRAGSWWVRAYAPELSMGLTTAEEAADFIDITPARSTTLAEVAHLAPVAETTNLETGEITIPAQQAPIGEPTLDDWAAYADQIIDELKMAASEVEIQEIMERAQKITDKDQAKRVISEMNKVRGRIGK